VIQATSQASPTATCLIKIANWDGEFQDIQGVLTTAFDAKDYLDCIKNLRAQNVDPLSYIDSLDKVGSPSIF